MLRGNDTDQQPGFFDTMWLMPRKTKERLLTSWTHVFCREDSVCIRIPPKLFAPLFSKIELRPDASTNIIIEGDLYLFYRYLYRCILSSATAVWSHPQVRHLLKVVVVDEHFLLLTSLSAVYR